ncbi:MAG: peptidoglycan DD-metalloendopeptidase family protein [Bacteroidetes bacterium]|nr:peptidoglycan DD-metalloendopeptidase family protein [Bacteroidota bacterium]
MKTPCLIWFVLLVLLAGGNDTARAQEDLQRHKDELESLRAQIRDLESRSLEQQRNETETLELLDTYDRKATLVRKLISRLKSEERRLQARIDTTRRTTRTLEAQLTFLKDHFSRYVRSVYKSGRLYDAEILFASSSLEQFVARNEYLRRFTDQRVREAQRIREKQKQYEEMQARAEKELSEERRVLAEKGVEEDRLVSLSNERRETLQRIRKDKNTIARQIQRQSKAAREMEALITRLVESERMRKERATAEQKLPRTPEAPRISGTFERKKGKLPWPVTEGSIVARFGPQRHPTLRTVTQNTGVDIAVRPGSAVAAVAPGEVATIWWLPWYGNLIILNHQDGYRTVYTHLADIDVTEGQTIAEGDILGTSGDTLDGPRLHFEVWKDQEKQNPDQWLTRQ